MRTGAACRRAKRPVSEDSGENAAVDRSEVAKTAGGETGTAGTDTVAVGKAAWPLGGEDWGAVASDPRFIVFVWYQTYPAIEMPAMPSVPNANQSGSREGVGGSCLAAKALRTDSRASAVLAGCGGGWVVTGRGSGTADLARSASTAARCEARSGSGLGAPFAGSGENGSRLSMSAAVGSMSPCGLRADSSLAFSARRRASISRLMRRPQRLGTILKGWASFG